MKKSDAARMSIEPILRRHRQVVRQLAAPPGAHDYLAQILEPLDRLGRPSLEQLEHEVAGDLDEGHAG